MGIVKYKQAAKKALIASILILAVMWLIPKIFSIDVSISHFFDKELYERYYHFDHQQQRAFYAIVGNYHSFPFWKKLLYLPITLVVQMFIPFPWNYERDIAFGYTEAYAHFAYPWYLFAGMVIYYVIYLLRQATPRMRMFTLWALFCWAVPCVLFGGTVSRYGLPAVILMAPCVAEVLTNHLRDKRFIRFSACYIAVLAIALPICYILQNSF